MHDGPIEKEKYNNSQDDDNNFIAKCVNVSVFSLFSFTQVTKLFLLNSIVAK